MSDLKDTLFVSFLVIFLGLFLVSVVVFAAVFYQEKYYPHAHADLVIGGDTCYCNVENFVFDECEGLVTFSCGVGDFALQCSDFELVEHHFGWFGKEK